MTFPLNILDLGVISLCKSFSINLSNSKNKIKVFNTSNWLVDVALVLKSITLLLVGSQQIFDIVLVDLKNTNVAYLVWVSKQIAAASVCHVVVW